MTDRKPRHAGSETENLTPEQHVALAWWQEENARCFYQQVAELATSAAYRELFVELAGDEAAHKRTLLELYEGLTKQRPSGDFPAGVLPDGVALDRLEGERRLTDLLATVRHGDLRAACDLAAEIERAALERYLHLQRSLADENARRIFEVLVIEERRHLDKLDTALAALAKPQPSGA